MKETGETNQENGSNLIENESVLSNETKTENSMNENQNALSGEQHDSTESNPQNDLMLSETETTQDVNAQNLDLSQDLATENTTQPEEIKDTEKKKRTASDVFKEYFTPLRITYLALFTALSIVMRKLEFFVIPAVDFLKVDFSNTFALIAGFALGPIAGVIVGVFKELVYALAASQSVGIGELANILMLLPYVLIPSIVYKKKKGIKVVLVSIVIACVVTIAWSVPVNYLISFPFFLKVRFDTPWESGMNIYITQYWYWAILFNLVKTVLISISALVLYKPLSRLIKATNKKFDKLKSNRKNSKRKLSKKTK